MNLKSAIFSFGLICGFSICANSQDFTKPDTIEVPISYDHDKSPYALSEKGRGDRKQINFYGDIDDSLSVYLNGKVIFSKKVKRNKDLASDLADLIPLKGLSNGKFYWIYVVSHAQSIYFEIPVDPRFYFISLHYDSRNKEYAWSAVYTNIIPYD